MKRFVLIFLLSIASFAGFAQNDEADDRGASRLQERMSTYIQKRLGLSKNEAQRFSPIFMRYIGELRRTHRENRLDKPMLQLKVAELRVRFRDEFRQVIDEQRANRVYDIQREFEEKVRDEIKQRQLDNRTGPRRNGLLSGN